MKWAARKSERIWEVPTCGLGRGGWPGPGRGSGWVRGCQIRRGLQGLARTTHLVGKASGAEPGRPRADVDWGGVARGQGW